MTTGLLFQMEKKIYTVAGKVGRGQEVLPWNIFLLLMGKMEYISAILAVGDSPKCCSLQCLISHSDPGHPLLNAGVCFIPTHFAGAVTQWDRFPAAAHTRSKAPSPRWAEQGRGLSLVLPPKADKAFLNHLTLVCSLNTTTTFVWSHQSSISLLGC